MSARILGALALTVFTAVAGRRGLYLYDAGIPYQYGWLIYNGLRPFVDFTSPLTPLSGMITALGFGLFGVKYLSGVWITALLSGVGFWGLSVMTEPILGKRMGWLAAMVLSLLTLPSFAVPFYNHILAFLLTLWAVAWVLRIWSSDSPLARSNFKVNLFIYGVVGLMILDKLQVGVLVLLTSCGFEALDLSERRGWSLAAFLRGMALRLGLPFAMGMGLLVWANFRIEAIAKALFKAGQVNPFPLDRLSLNRTLDVGTTIWAQPQLTLISFAVVLACVALWHLSLRLRDLVVARLLLLGAGIWLQQVAISINSGEAPSINASCGAILLLISLLVARRNMARLVSGNDWLVKLPDWGSLPLWIMLAWFGISYAWFGGRKAWSDFEFKFVESRYEQNIAESRIPFFRSVTMSRDQQRCLDYIYAFVSRNPQMKYHFGAGLELLYPATQRLPGAHWPVWMHYSISFSQAEIPALFEEFRAFNPDVVVLAGQRMFLSRFLLPYLKENYVPLDLPGRQDMWIDILVRKGLVSAVHMP